MIMALILKLGPQIGKLVVAASTGNPVAIAMLVAMGYEGIKLAVTKSKKN